ncbi:hypothetical protein, partial [Liquorilactobacillus sicerae]|uniref:hypothetical protein n=1 Tax=Liquorilactobacillus sicerae TaxID=1416943 RepID=UPI002480BEB1
SGRKGYEKSTSEKCPCLIKAISSFSDNSDSGFSSRSLKIFLADINASPKELGRFAKARTLAKENGKVKTTTQIKELLKDELKAK